MLLLFKINNNVYTGDILIELNKDKLKQVLLQIDKEYGLLDTKLDYKPIVMVVGGCAFILQGFSSRPVTHDIDVMSYDAILRQIIEQYNILNSQVKNYEDSLPYNYEDRLIILDIGAKNIEFITPSLEDLVVMKLYGVRPNDLQDINSDEVINNIDWDMMDYLVFSHDEAYSSNLIRRRYYEMVEDYKIYAKEHGHEPDIQRFS